MRSVAKAYWELLLPESEIYEVVLLTECQLYPIYVVNSAAPRIAWLYCGVLFGAFHVSDCGCYKRGFKSEPMTLATKLAKQTYVHTFVYIYDMYIYIYIFVHIHTHIHIYIFICRYIYGSACICVHIFIYVHIYVYLYDIYKWHVPRLAEKC